MPNTADSENVSANYEDGILKLTVGKKKEAIKDNKRNIQIK
jgi:HSP20 family molecular chaperone IbpA